MGYVYRASSYRIKGKIINNIYVRVLLSVCYDVCFVISLGS